MNQRASIFSDPIEIDVSDFAPKARDTTRPAPEEIDQAAGRRFKSREPSSADVLVKDNAADPVPTASTKRQPMVYRTGRNVVFSAKTTPATIERFYMLAQQNGWKAGETFEKAVAALEREIDTAAG